MTLAKAKAKAYETFIVQASLTIVTYDRQNIFIVQDTASYPRAEHLKDASIRKAPALSSNIRLGWVRFSLD